MTAMQVGLFLAAAAIAWLIGGLIVSLAWPRSGRHGAEWILRCLMAMLVGVGATSLAAAVSAHAWPALPMAWIAGDIAMLTLLAVTYVGLARRSGGPGAGSTPSPFSTPDAPDRAWPTRPWRVLAVVALLIQAGIALSAMMRMVAVSPHGIRDAFGIWNLKARIITRSGDAWLTAFAQMDWRFHPDYPLLTPLTVARAWIWTGETIHVPQIIAIGQALLVAALLAASVAAWRGWGLGALAGMVCLASPVMLLTGHDQIADGPLAGFILASLVLVMLAFDHDERSPRVPPAEAEASASPADDETSPASGLWWLAGCCAGLAAWTKNEGLAFAFAASVMVTVGLAWRRGSTWRPVLRRLAAWGMGLAIPLAFVLHHKLTVAGATDLAAQQDLATLLARATDPGRWSAILSRFAGLAWSTPGQMTSTWSGLSFRLPLIVLLIALVIVQGLSPPAGLRRGLIVGLGSLGLLALAVFTALLLTPHDLTWHLDAAAYRMPVMFYPSVLMLIFVSLRAPPACEPSVGRG